MKTRGDTKGRKPLERQHDYNPAMVFAPSSVVFRCKFRLCINTWCHARSNASSTSRKIDVIRFLLLVLKEIWFLRFTIKPSWKVNVFGRIFGTIAIYRGPNITRPNTFYTNGSRAMIQISLPMLFTRNTSVLNLIYLSTLKLLRHIFHTIYLSPTKFK